MAQRYEYQDIDGHVILLFVHPAPFFVMSGDRDSRKEVGEIKKVVSLCYEYRYTTLTGKLDATSRYAYSL